MITSWLVYEGNICILPERQTNGGDSAGAICSAWNSHQFFPSIPTLSSPRHSYHKVRPLLSVVWWLVCPKDLQSYMSRVQATGRASYAGQVKRMEGQINVYIQNLTQLLNSQSIHSSVLHFILFPDFCLKTRVQLTLTTDGNSSLFYRYLSFLVSFEVLIQSPNYLVQPSTCV